MVSPFSSTDIKEEIDNAEDETDWSLYQKEIKTLSSELDFTEKTDDEIRRKDREKYAVTLGNQDRKKFATSLSNVAVLPEVKKALFKKGFRNHRIITHWKEIIGEELAYQIKPIQIVHRKDGKGTLRLKVTPAMAFRIHHMQSMIIDRVNTYFGEKSIERLSLEQSTDISPVTVEDTPPETPCIQVKRYLDIKTEKINHEGLKQALISLGMSVLKTQDVQGKIDAWDEE